MEKDYPKRLQIPGGVVHAAHTVVKPAHTRYKYDRLAGRNIAIKKVPAETVTAAACDETYLKDKHVRAVELDPTTPITCKKCLKKIGGEQEPAKDACKYVLQERASGYFFKKYGWRGGWVEDIYRATLYQMETVATQNGHKYFYQHLSSGKRISVATYKELSRDEKKKYINKSEFDHEKFTVRKVTLKLE